MAVVTVVIVVVVVDVDVVAVMVLVLLVVLLLVRRRWQVGLCALANAFFVRVQGLTPHGLKVPAGWQLAGHFKHQMA